jgi:hypothetical protein
MKKSSWGFADVSLSLASSGGEFFLVCGFTDSFADRGEAFATGGGCFWVFGATVALPKGFDFGNSVCALKLHTLKTAIRIRRNDFIVFGRKCLLGVV